MDRTILGIVVASLLATTAVLPATASAIEDQPESVDTDDEEVLLECILYYRVAVTDCPDYYEPPEETAGILDEDNDDSFYECMKNGGFVGYCLEKTGVLP
ncbi:hypothetical protein BRD56_03195 [Thermoplasmatales archaeon SW_10_69_26]|nr:MAG: hypothetical protein BRD56_03195 [Thermoplasmatales archaeon SW_10_69_26]